MLGLLRPPVQPCLVQDDPAVPFFPKEARRLRQAERQRLLEHFLKRLKREEEVVDAAKMI